MFQNYQINFLNMLPLKKKDLNVEIRCICLLIIWNQWFKWWNLLKHSIINCRIGPDFITVDDRLANNSDSDKNRAKNICKKNEDIIMYPVNYLFVDLASGVKRYWRNCILARSFVGVLKWASSTRQWHWGFFIYIYIKEVLIFLKLIISSNTW